MAQTSSTGDSAHSGGVDARATVCHVLHSLVVGGCEALARNLAIEQSDEFRPVFALLDEVGALGHELAERGYLVECIGRRKGLDFGCARRLAGFLNQHEVTFVHAHQYGPLFYSALARLARPGMPILFHEHGRDHPDYRRPKRVLANRLLLSRRDHFVAVGENVREALVRFEGLQPDRIDVIYNGIDLSAHHPDRPARAEVRRELQLLEDDFVVFQVARLHRLKDHPTALRAVKAARAKLPNMHLVLVGDGEDRRSLELYCSELGLNACVHFLGSRGDVPRLLQGADAFLLSSISEGIPLTLIEAMATALPCVATNVGGVPEVLVNGETGFLAPPGDDQILANHLAALSADRGLRARMGQAGRHRAEARFSSGAMHARFRQLYRRLTDSDRRPESQPRPFTVGK